MKRDDDILQSRIAKSISFQKYLGPLKSYFGITGFSYSIFFRSYEYINFNTNTDFLKHFHFHHNTPDMAATLPPLFDLPVGTIGSYIFPKPQKGDITYDMQLFGLYYCIVIYEVKRDAIHMWGFWTTIENEEIINFFLNDLHLLKKFILHLKQSTHNFQTSEPKTKFLVDIIKNFPKKRPSQIALTQFNQNFQDSLKIKKYYLNNSQEYLTRREYDCLEGFSEGLSYKETAKKLTLSPKTVEFYINNIKNKHDLSTKSDLIDFFNFHFQYWQ